MRYYPVLALMLLIACTSIPEISEQRLNEGKHLAFDRSKGNCLACHAIEDGEAPGNIGPVLTALKTRFSDKQQLHEQIFDATRFNPETSMPPFGKNKILTDEEIDKIVDYLWSLP